MIRRWLEAIADRLRDNDWLHERRKVEVLSRRHTQHIQRRTRIELGEVFESDAFPKAQKRKRGGQA